MLQKLKFNPGINKEITSLSGEGGWYDCDLVRFRAGFPEKIGGWIPIAREETFLGTGRTMINWVTLASENLLGIGTHLKYYIERGGTYNDITPIRDSHSIVSNAFTTTSGSKIVQIHHTGHGAATGDFITLTTASTVGGLTPSVLNGNYSLTVVDSNSYTIDVGVNASSTATSGAATVDYELSIGNEIYSQGTGWGAGPWGGGTTTGWGQAAGIGVGVQLRLWNQANFGEWLLYGIRGGEINIWKPDDNPNLYERGTPLVDEPGASDVPTMHNCLLVSDVSSFVIVFGTNPLFEDYMDPMMVRWADQESVVNWTPHITNQASFQRLSNGSYIVTAKQTRQEILIWTDTALYSMQYIGPPYVWSFNLIANNISIASPNAVTVTDDATYWMGNGNFYVYNGRTDTLPCLIRKHVFEGMNHDQIYQVVSGTNQDFNEVWWFYCSAGQTSIDRYAVFNFVDGIWYPGTRGRTAWLDSPLRRSPMGIKNGQVYFHESGTDDGETNPPSAMDSYIQSADIDIGDGDKFSFLWRIIPDISFNGSTVERPVAQIYVRPRTSPGSGYTLARGGVVDSQQDFSQTRAYPIEHFTQYVYARARGRQLAIKVGSNTIGTQWQLGQPRLDLREDGRAG